MTSRRLTIEPLLAQALASSPSFIRKNGQSWVIIAKAVQFSTNVSQEVGQCVKAKVADLQSAVASANPLTHPTNPPTHSAKSPPSCDAVQPGEAECDQDLARVIEAWPALSAAIRRAVVVIVQSVHSVES